jgi:hypothetical protein
MIRMLKVSEEFVPELDAFVGATGTAHEPQAREQGRRNCRVNLRCLPDRPGTTPNIASAANNERDEAGQHEDDKRVIALEQILRGTRSSWLSAWRKTASNRGASSGSSRQTCSRSARCKQRSSAASARE